VSCPECQQRIKVPVRKQYPRRTSAYALASVVLALVGAFTPATLVAVVLGVVALVDIARHRDRLAAAGLPSFGSVLGTLLGPLPLFGLGSGELFGLGGWLRERTLAPVVDTSGPLEIVHPLSGFAITRPSEKWGQVNGSRVEDPALSGIQKDRDLLLVQP